MRRDNASRAMRHHPPRRTRAHLDRVLDGQPTQPDPLDDLVAALHAPGSPRESVGLDAALAAFAAPAEAAQPPTTLRRPSMLKTLVGKVLAAKLMAVGASALAVGGVAYAASTGHLPDPLPHSSKAAPAAASHVPTALPASATPSKTAHASDHGKAHSASHPTGAPATHPAASPSPSLVGLCHAWLARPADAGKADQTPAAAALITAAGGKASVTSYCTTLLSTTKPSHHSTGKPTETRTKTHPTGKPTDAPTHPAPPHPTGKPVTAPTHHHSDH